ncbi:tetratricopeptide repeat protein [Rhodocytophaga rosea]|uniref:protein O-GlcNAc transferase n=1 Tax=Rhodocytophaga rosea TaxID=2704465 RepID=A0A6C0GCY4_9BACT|nr:glycosyltransferase family 41 protein [Rhodocytophaga rosea]QHT65831.1 tetratricopeptide repeat protein [Rhodocytophaga rosea]
MDKKTWQELFLKATQAHQQNKLTEAEQQYRQLLQVNPYQADVLHLLGIVCSQQSRHEEAIAYIQKAIRLYPEVPVFYNNLGEVFARKGETDRAMSSFRKAIQLAPDFAEAHYNLANVLKQAGHLTQAIDSYTRTLQLKPVHIKALYNLGNAYMEQGLIKSAMECYQQVVHIQPNFAEAHNNLGIAWQEWDNWEEATMHYQKATLLNPDFSEAFRNLASALETQGKTEESLFVYQQMVRKDPANLITRFQADTIPPVIFNSAAQIQSYRTGLLSTLDFYTTQDFRLDLSKLQDTSLQPSSILIYQGENDRHIKEKYATVFNKYFTGYNQVKFTRNSSLPHIGFVVTAGHEGVFIKCMRGILNNLSDTQFKITVICSAPNGEKILRPAISNPGVLYLSIPKRFDQAVETMQLAKFDILYYWEVGTDAINYFLPYVRIAPIQCTSWGWPVTSGIPNIDYFISSKLLEIPQSQDQYSEKLVQFNRLPVYYYFPQAPGLIRTRSDFNIPEKAHLYVCTQNLRKVHPDFDQMIARILRLDTQGILAFISDKHTTVTELLKSRFAQHFPELTDRIHFLPRMDEDDYFQVLTLADVVLDTLYYGGGANTTYDAFAVGTPVITLPTEFHRGRYAYAAYQQMGIEKCIAANSNEYVQKAVRIASIPEYRAEISRKIKAAHQAVFEDKQAVTELSEWLLSVWQEINKISFEK